jgi:hypothetical protein
VWLDALERHQRGFLEVPRAQPDARAGIALTCDLALASERAYRPRVRPARADPRGGSRCCAAADANWDGALAMEEFAEPSCFTTRAFADAVRELSER